MADTSDRDALEERVRELAERYIGMGYREDHAWKAARKARDPAYAAALEAEIRELAERYMRRLGYPKDLAWEAARAGLDPTFSDLPRYDDEGNRLPRRTAAELERNLAWLKPPSPEAVARAREWAKEINRLLNAPDDEADSPGK